jgi:predicted aspartyl protease
MRVASGFFNSGGSPCVNFRLSGVLAGSAAKEGFEFEAVIDTGFDGFVSMPMAQAFPLGLPLRGAIEVTLADGRNATKLHALGRAMIGDRANWGAVILEPASDEILIGLKFLQVFDLALVLTRSEVLLFERDEDWLNGLYLDQDSIGIKEPPPPDYYSRQQRSHRAARSP